MVKLRGGLQNPLIYSSTCFIAGQVPIYMTILGDSSTNSTFFTRHINPRYQYGNFKANNASITLNSLSLSLIANFGISFFWVIYSLSVKPFSALSSNLFSNIYNQQWLLLFCLAILHPKPPIQHDRNPETFSHSHCFA